MSQLERQRSVSVSGRFFDSMVLPLSILLLRQPLVPQDATHSCGRHRASSMVGRKSFQSDLATNRDGNVDYLRDWFAKEVGEDVVVKLLFLDYFLAFSNVKAGWSFFYEMEKALEAFSYQVVVQALPELLVELAYDSCFSLVVGKHVDQIVFHSELKRVIKDMVSSLEMQNVNHEDDRLRSDIASVCHMIQTDLQDSFSSFQLKDKINRQLVNSWLLQGILNNTIPRHVIDQCEQCLDLHANMEQRMVHALDPTISEADWELAKYYNKQTPPKWAVCCSQPGRYTHWMPQNTLIIQGRELIGNRSV